MNDKQYEISYFDNVADAGDLLAACPYEDVISITIGNNPWCCTIVYLNEVSPDA